MNKENIKQFLPLEAKVEYFNNVAFFEVHASLIQKITLDLWKEKNLQLKQILATDERKERGSYRIWYIFGSPKEHVFIIPYIELINTEQFPSITLDIPGALNYEKQIHTFFGLTPVGHPDLRQSILHENWPLDMFPLRKDFDWKERPKEANGTYDFQIVDGEGMYEIPVGPIHAGIIEPGHFRFSVAGEEIVLLEAKLGYVHKGSEKLFEQFSLDKQVCLSEKISGDSSFSHSLAFCQAVEQLGEVMVPQRAKYLRVLYAELERLANHFGDIAFIMLDTGFNFGGTNGTRLREMIMRINERLTGSRFLRGVNVCGGVTKDITDQERINVAKDLEKILIDFTEVMQVAEKSNSLLFRLNGAGVLSRQIALDFCATGVPAKAVGIKNDVRVDYPYAAYNEVALDKIETEENGDVCARFHVRVKEVYASIKLIKQALRNLPSGPIAVSIGSLQKNVVAISSVEGWRGEILYFVKTDSQGIIERVAPRDPSSINWMLLGYAGAHNVVPDFPLINKSFNLSYTGNDL